MASVKKLLMSQQPVSYGAMAKYPVSAELKKKFSTHSRFGDDIILWEETPDGKYLLLPRAVCPVGGEDLRTTGYPVNIGMKTKPKDAEQARVYAEALELLGDGQSFVIQAGTGTGKCHGIDTPILMHSGHVKMVQDVHVGDRLMGPDGAPRKVLSLARGRDQLYRIVPTKGEPWVGNAAHILSLVYIGRDANDPRKGEIVNVSIQDYLGWSAKQKHLHKQRRSSGIDWMGETDTDVYLLGLYLAEGTRREPCFNLGSHEQVLIDHVLDTLWKIGAKPGEPYSSRGCSQLRFSKYSSLWQEFCLCNDGDGKFIPHKYKANAMASEKLRLLAGLIDGDGSLSCNGYDYISKYPRLANDVAFMCRSLGLAAYVTECRKGIASTGFEGTYWRVSISGAVNMIPVRLPHKKASPRQQKKNVLHTGFTVEPVGEGYYYGFEIDKDHLYLLGDFTITHNTWVALALAAALGVPVLVVCTKDDLVTQWKQRILQHTDVEANQIGLIQQNTCDVYGKKIVIASIKSLSIPGRYPPAIRSLFGLVVYDEVHRLGADTFQTVSRMFPAKWRLGLSATPVRIDGKEIVFFANIGPIRVVGVGVPMIPKVLRYDSGWRCPRIRQTDKVTGEKKLVKLPHMAGKAGHVLKYLLRDQDRNKLIVWLMKKAYANNRRAVIFSNQIDHLELLRDLGVKAGIPTSAFGQYYGSSSEAKLDAAAIKPMVLATPGKAGDGTDKPWWDCAFLVSPFSNVAQIAGRVLREYPDKLQPVIFDISDRDSHVFAGYENKRDEYYASVGGKVKEMTNGADA